MFSFAAVAILGQSLVRNQFKSVGKTDFTVFILASVVLWTSDNLGREMISTISKIRNFRNGVRSNNKSSSDEQSSATLQPGVKPIVGLGMVNRLISFLPFMSKKTNDGIRSDNIEADNVTILGVIVNLLLSLGKFAVGVTCHSSVLVADAGHSLSDLFSDFVTLYTVQIARLPPDDDHPYGHGKFEAIGSLFLALTLFGTGISVGASSNAKLLQILQAQAVASAAGGASAAASVTLPTFPALIMAALSITSKEWLYRITKVVGEETNSQVVIANAWHHRSDAYSSILALGSIGLAMAVPGMVAADAAAGLLVAGMICMTGAEIMGEAVNQLTDTSDEDLGERVKVMLAEEETDDVVNIKRIRTRWMGSSAVIDLSITTPGQTSSSANRAIEERVKYKIMNREPDIIDAEVHASSDSVVCPLLTATNVWASEDVSVQGVEDDAREILMAHEDVASVEKCIVHYSETVNVNVDVSIKLENSESATVHSAAETGKELKDILQKSNLIHTARIYLDLNESQEEFSLPTSIFSKPASVRP